MEATLGTITAAVVDAVSGADDAVISLVPAGGRLEIRAPTGDRSAALDVLRIDLGQGSSLA